MTAGSTHAHQTKQFGQLKQHLDSNTNLHEMKGSFTKGRHMGGGWEQWRAAVVRDVWDFMACRGETVSCWSMFSWPLCSGPVDLVLHRTHNPGSPLKCYMSADCFWMFQNFWSFVYLNFKTSHFANSHPSVHVFQCELSPGEKVGPRVQAIRTVCCGLSPPLSLDPFD